MNARHTARLALVSKHLPPARTIVDSGGVVEGAPEGHYC